MEAVGATASIVGIVSFGLGLAKCLQAFIDTVIEAEETITLITAEVNATALTLKRLQDFIDQDRAAAREENGGSVLNEAGIKEIGVCAAHCQRIYVQIIVLIEKASGQPGEGGGSGRQAGVRATTSTAAAAAEDLNASADTLDAFSARVVKMGRRLRWPWLEPRIHRCQEHLARLKTNLMLSLQVFCIAKLRVRPAVAHVLGTGNEDEMREKAEILRTRMTEFRAKRNRPSSRSSSRSSSRPSPASDSSSSSRNLSDSDSDSDSDTSSYSSPRPSSSFRRRLRQRLFNILSALKATMVYMRNNAERRATFKKDTTSTIFEAYLVTASTAAEVSQKPMKLAFGHRRLIKQVKRALRRGNPWDILLILSQNHRLLVDSAIQHVRDSASESASVCLVAIDIDGFDTNADISTLEVGELLWTRMVLFFCYEWTSTSTGGKTGTELGIFRSMLLGINPRKRRLLEFQEAQKQKVEQERRLEEQAKIQEEKSDVEKRRAALDMESKKLETDRLAIEKEKQAVEIKQQVLQNAEESVLKSLANGAAEEELKNQLREEYKKRAEEECAKSASNADLPVKFKDAVGRKFSFPFHLARKWKVMESLINQAFEHVEHLGPRVRSGHYDLEGPEGDQILKSEEIWDTTIKPGWHITMSMWPQTGTMPGPGGPGLPPGHGIGPGSIRIPPGLSAEQQREFLIQAMRLRQQQHMGGVGGSIGRMSPQGSTGPPPMRDAIVPPMGFPAANSIGMATPPKEIDVRRDKKSSGKKKSSLSWLGGKPSTRKSAQKHQKSSQSSRKDSTDSERGRRNSTEIDMELGLDGLEALEKLASKDVDELLEAWTKPATEPPG